MQGHGKSGDSNERASRRRVDGLVWQDDDSETNRNSARVLTVGTVEMHMSENKARRFIPSTRI